MTNKYIKQENSLRFFDRYFKTGEYRKLQKSKQEYEEHEFLKRL